MRVDTMQGWRPCMQGARPPWATVALSESLQRQMCDRMRESRSWREDEGDSLADGRNQHAMRSVAGYPSRHEIPRWASHARSLSAEGSSVC